MLNYSFLPEDGHCRPKHVGEELHIYKLSSFYSFAVVGTNIVNVEKKFSECLKCLCLCLLLLH